MESPGRECYDVSGIIKNFFQGVIKVHSRRFTFKSSSAMSRQYFISNLQPKFAVTEIIAPWHDKALHVSTKFQELQCEEHYFAAI